MLSFFKQSYIPYILFAVGMMLIFAYMKTKEGFESPSVASDLYKFVLYYADWCPHCHTAKPEFDKLGSTQTIGGKRVEMQALEEKQIPKTVKVSGYPTVHLYDAQGTLVKEYSGARTQEGFQSFLQSSLAA